MTQVKVRFTRDAVPYAAGEEAWFDEDHALILVEQAHAAELCEDLTPDSTMAPSPGAAAGVEVSSPPTTSAAHSIVPLVRKRR